MKKKEQKNNDMFPIHYKGKLWFEKDCRDEFLAFYSHKFCLTCDSSVYLMGGVYMFPDGKLDCEDDEDNDFYTNEII